MEKDLLQAVIRVESEILQSLESERKKAAEWFESTRTSLRDEYTALKMRLDEEYSRSLEAACNECEVQAQKEIAAVERKAVHLQNLPESVRLEIVRDFLMEILPGEQG